MIFTMVGASFRPSDARAVVTHLDVGDTAELIADPENQYDNTAVKVEYEGTHIGFVPKDMNEELFIRLQDGEQLQAEIIAFENTLKPTFEVE